MHAEEIDIARKIGKALGTSEFIADFKFAF